ncbi:MAG TPA: hypothetical protein VF765_37010 [Polyangiaceae bacterium]
MRIAKTSSVLALALTCACSASSSSSSGTSDSDAGGGDGGHPQVTCNQLKAADVQGLMTAMVTGVDVTAVGTDSDGQQCVFHDAQSEQAVDIIVIPASDPIIGYAIAKMSATNPVAVSGVGDQAFRDTGDFGPTAEHGGVMCTVSTASAVQIPGVDALVQNGMVDLTEAQNGILAAALGTVCNRIFGSGNTTPMLGSL